METIYSFKNVIFDYSAHSGTKCYGVTGCKVCMCDPYEFGLPRSGISSLSNSYSRRAYYDAGLKKCLKRKWFFFLKIRNLQQLSIDLVRNSLSIQLNIDSVKQNVTSTNKKIRKTPWKVKITGHDAYKPAVTIVTS